MTEKEDKKIRRAFKKKGWNEEKTNDSWGIFKVMSEFVALSVKLQSHKMLTTSVTATNQKV